MKIETLQDLLDESLKLNPITKEEQLVGRHLFAGLSKQKQDEAFDQHLMDALATFNTLQVMYTREEILEKGEQLLTRIEISMKH